MTDNGEITLAEQPLDTRLANYKMGPHCALHIPKPVRESVAACLSQCIEKCFQDNDIDAWEKLFCFAYYVLTSPPGTDDSTRKTIEKNIQMFNEGKYNSNMIPKKEQYVNTEESTIALVKKYMDKRDLKSAHDLLFQEKLKVVTCESTRKHLEDKHPKRKENMNILQIESTCEQRVTVDEIKGAINSFKDDSASGIDGLSARHIKYLIKNDNDDTTERLLASLCKLADFMIAGKVNSEVTKYLYGAHLVALTKNDGNIRPIAVGNTIRRITAKVVNKRLAQYVAEKMIPRQVGYGCKGGTDASIHATRHYIDNNKETTKAVLKVDFTNAFNTVHRDTILKSIQDDENLRPYYSYFFQTLASSSNLFFGESIISSETGVQQGDPLGPMIFCWVTHPYYLKLKSELCVWYTDDGTLSDDPDIVLDDLREIMSWEEKLGLKLNLFKCELCVFTTSAEVEVETAQKFRKIAPTIKVIEKKDLCMLGSPLTDEAVLIELRKRINRVPDILKPLKYLEKKHIETFLKTYTDIPKIVQLLRTCPTWKYPEILQEYDNSIKDFYKEIGIVSDDTNWMERSLPVKDGGLGLRLASRLALSAYLASVYSGEALIGKIYKKRKFQDNVDEPIKKWCKLSNMEEPLSFDKTVQKEWDNPIIEQQLVEVKLFKENK